MFNRAGVLSLVRLGIVVGVALFLRSHADFNPIDKVYAQTSCDVSACPRTCTMTSDPENGYSIAGPTDYCSYPVSGCLGSMSYDNGQGCCQSNVTPIVIDLSGNGYHLTDPDHGVPIQIVQGQDQLYQLSWTRPDSNNAWLVLDRNNNGQIDGLWELFGNMTQQPEPDDGLKNGYRALAIYDEPENGGDGDGMITAADAIYSSLRLWVDGDQDGRSAPSELSTLASKSVASISLNYRLSRRTDEYGNLFRYRSRIRFENNPFPRWSWDVILKTGDD